MRPRALVLLTPLLLASTAVAQIRFERQAITIKATPDQTRAAVEYPFTNTGEKALAIQSIEVDCDCSTLKTDKPTYAPGEKGVLSVVFEFGQRVGTQDKTITILTDQGKATARLVVEIPELLTTTPRLVFWRAGEAQPKTIRLTALEGTNLRITKVDVAEAIVAVEIKTIEEGKTYDLVVTPLPNAKPGTTALTIHTDYPPAHPRTFTAFAKILKPEP